MQADTGKQLFAHPYRKRRRAGLGAGLGPERSARLASGQALSEAQRLSRPRARPSLHVLLLMCAEVVAVLATGAAAWGLFPSPVSAVLAMAEVWVGALAALAAIRATRGYRLWRMRVPRLSLTDMGLGLALALGAVLAAHAVLWGTDPAMVPRLVVWGLMAGLAMAAARMVVWHRIRSLTRLGVLEHRLVVVGGGHGLAPILRDLDHSRHEGYRVCGFFDARSDARSPAMLAGLHKMGDLDDLVDFVRMAQIDTVIVAIPDLSPARLMEMLAVLSALPVEVRSVATETLNLSARVPRSRIGLVDLVELCRPPIGGYSAVQKRVFDLVAASAAIVLLAPVLAGVALAVRLDSPGPILFRQTRHGFNNKPIKVLKFRSMYVEACDPSAVRAVRQGDARVTRVGRFIRRTSLDELPQLFNVLAGELSMVGPRPHATAARTGDILFDEVTARYSARHKVKPGITGWAQVNGWRGEMNSSEKIRARVEHDLYYIENWSLWFDVKILAMTPRALIAAKNAY